jgi:hypothetical protein
MLQERWLSTLAADAVDSLAADLLARQKVPSAQQQKERHQHRRIKRTPPETAAKHPGPELLSVTSGVVIRGPLIIEVVPQVHEQLFDCRFSGQV